MRLKVFQLQPPAEQEAVSKMFNILVQVSRVQRAARCDVIVMEAKANHRPLQHGDNMVAT